MEISPPLLAEMSAHAEEAWPGECCGVLTDDRDGSLQYIRIPNIAGTAAAGETSSRSTRDGYVMDPRALMAALEAAEARGGGLRAVVHSHPEVGAYFSAEDRRAALGGGDEPLWPEVAYLVLSCRGRKVNDARLYRWVAAARDFAEQALIR